MLHLRRRHLTSCPHRNSAYLKCKCPLWAVGVLEGKFVRRSLDTRNLERANRLVRDMELGKALGVKIEDAAERFAEHLRSRHLSGETVKKFERLKGELAEHFAGMGLSALSVDDVSRFFEGWEGRPSTKRKKLERLSSFFRFCVARKWMVENPAAAVRPPKEMAIERKPFEQGELEKIAWAIPLFPKKGIYRENNRERIAAFVAVLRWTGLRIRDVVQLQRSQIRGDHIVLRTHKNQKPVKLPIHPEMKIALGKVGNGEFFFWSGLGNPKSCVGDWQRTLRRLSELAGVHIHAHRFRHTFATDLLSKGVPVSEVAAILGNSPRIVEQHYAQWVESRQAALTAAVKLTW